MGECIQISGSLEKGGGGVKLFMSSHLLHTAWPSFS